METLLQNAAVAAIGALAGEFCLCMLPAGSTRKFCRFAVSLMLILILLAAPMELGEIDFPQLKEESRQTEYAEQNKSYEEIIWDVYNGELENKNK